VTTGETVTDGWARFVIVEFQEQRIGKDADGKGELGVDRLPECTGLLVYMPSPVLLDVPGCMTLERSEEVSIECAILRQVGVVVATAPVPRQRGLRFWCNVRRDSSDATISGQVVLEGCDYTKGSGTKYVESEVVSDGEAE
jgi:hypothetical protein